MPELVGRVSCGPDASAAVDIVTDNETDKGLELRDVILKWGGVVLFFRTLSFDGLCVLPRQPLSYLMMIVPMRMIIIYLESLFPLVSGFFDQDISPQLMLLVYLGLYACNGLNKRFLWNECRYRRFYTCVLFIIAPALLVHRLTVTYAHKHHLTQRVVAAFGNQTFVHSQQTHIFSLRDHLMNRHGELDDHLSPSERFVYKRFHVPRGGLNCKKSLFTRLPWENTLKRHSKRLEQGFLELEVYKPLEPWNEAHGKSPVIVFIHGGGWSVGGPGVISINSHGGGIPYNLLKQGFTIVSVSYRLACTNTVGMGMVEDVRDAIHTIIARAHEWNADPQRLIVWGTSSGGHLGLTVSYLERNIPQIKGVISFYGPTDLRVNNIREGANPSWMDRFHSSVFISMTRHLCHANLTNHLHPPSCFAKISPVALVHRDAPPTLLVHGSSDPVVPLYHATMLQEKLEKFNVSHALVEIPCATHSCDIFCSSPCSQAAQFSIDRFLYRTLKH